METGAEVPGPSRSVSVLRHGVQASGPPCAIHGLGRGGAAVHMAELLVEVLWTSGKRGTFAQSYTGWFRAGVPVQRPRRSIHTLQV